MRSILALVTVAGLMVPASSQTGPQPCPMDTTVLGYSSIFTLNSDMLFELARISSGGDPMAQYVFTLCPFMDFDFDANSNNGTNVPLMPVLDRSVFQCGDMGSQLDACVFLGGTTQVVIEDSNVPGYPLETVEFRGVSFAEFTDAALAGGAGENTTVFFVESFFEVSDCLCLVRNLQLIALTFSVFFYRILRLKQPWSSKIQTAIRSQWTFSEVLSKVVWPGQSLLMTLEY
jgi:hypothetical protein